MKTKFLSSWMRSTIIVGFTLMSVGCNLADGGATSHLPPDQFFAAFSLEHHAINLSTIAPYDTVTLNTIATMADGSSLTGEISYSVSSPAISVTDGILKAEGAVTRAVVRVKLTNGTVTRIDSAIVSVITTAPPLLGDFGIRLSTTDSAKVAVGEFKTIPLVRQSESGSNLSSLQVSLWSSDTTVAKITQSNNNVNITTTRPGRVEIHAATFAFGVERKDSLVFTVGWPLFFQLPIVEKFRTGSSIKILDFAYPDITVGVGGCVVWSTKNSQLDIDVQFHDTTHVVPPTSCAYPLIRDRTTGGNIAPYRAAIVLSGLDSLFKSHQARSFSAPGVFLYESSIHATKGVVRVCDEGNDTTCAPQGIRAWY